MLPEVKAVESQLKQILYGCVEHVQATKAALYLAATADLNEKVYEVVTSYQYNDPERKVVKEHDEVVDRVAVKRGAFFINGLGTDTRFSEILFRQSTDRILVAPLYARGRLVGFIDMRDKAGKKPFENRDIDAAKRITDEMLAFLGSRQIYGIGPIPVTSEPPPRVAPSAVAPARGGAQTSTEAPPPPAPRAEDAIQAAREIMTKRQLAQTGGRRSATERDAELFRLALPSALAIPGAVLAAVSVTAHAENPLSLVTLATLNDDAIDVLHRHLEEKLRGDEAPNLIRRPPLLYPFGVQPVPIGGGSITATVTVPVVPQLLDGLFLTVAFERTDEARAARAVTVFLKQMEHVFDAAVVTNAARADRQVIAEKLLEPDFERYPELAEHCREVASVAQRFASLLELPPAQVDCIRLAAYVHDVGFRLLDYQRIYRPHNLTPDEQKAIAEHPTIGAALVEPLLGPDIAQVVLRHHERVDGTGYPSRLSGAQIPITAKVLQIADAWVAMTSRTSYQAPLTPEDAVGRLRQGAGLQFDDQLVGRFTSSIAQFTD